VVPPFTSAATTSDPSPETTDPGRAFVELRSRLVNLAYRMFGSWSEAEDVVQDTHLAWAQRDHSDVLSPRAFLETAVTRRCLDVMKSARARREAYVGPWLPEPILTTELEAERDPRAVSLAFLTMLERLSPLERAVFVLAEAFDYSHDELARTLGKEPAAVRQLLHRAREHVAARQVRFAPNAEAHQAVLASFFGAVMSGDVAQVEQLLVEQAYARTDSGGKARAARNVVSGANRVARFFLGLAQKAPSTYGYVPMDVNGWPSIVTVEDGRVINVLQLETDGHRVVGVDIIVNPEKLSRLSAQVAAHALPLG
jgi:RNA polymerase sigma-70 factor (ECF subfamily)